MTAADGKKTNIYEDKDDGVYVKKGDTAPYVTKTADKETANVGDKITYTVKVGNGDGAVYEIENAKMADTIPAEFDFVDGSVQVDGKSYPYSYDNTSRKLTPVDGYDKLQNVLTGDGETPGVLELNDGEYAYLDGNLYAVGGKLYRMATISDEDGNSSNQLVELLIADDGALSLGEIVDLGDTLCVVETYGDETYTYTRTLSNPCSFGGMLYALSYGEELELLALNLEDESVEALTVDVDGDVQNIAPYTEGKLLMTVVDYTTETPSTTLWLYDIENEEAAELGALPTNGYQTPAGLAYDEARGKMYYVLAGSVWRIDVGEDGLGEPEEFGDMPLMYANGNGVVYGDLYVLASYDAVVGRDVTLDKLPAQRMRVANGDYVDSINKAYYAFTDKHPEYMISISTTLDTDSLLQSMMNRDSSVDIYTLPSTSSAFTSLMNRGFMAELEGSQTISDAVNAMYGFSRITSRRTATSTRCRSPATPT